MNTLVTLLYLAVVPAGLALGSGADHLAAVGLAAVVAVHVLLRRRAVRPRRTTPRTTSRPGLVARVRRAHAPST